MVCRGQKPPRSPPSPSTLFPAKKNSSRILSSFQALWRQCSPAFSQQRVAERAQALSLSSLLCLGRHSVTGLLTTCGREFQDWSAEYRLFSRQRLPTTEIFSVIRRAVLAELPPHSPLCVAVDDSLLRKTGIRIPGVAWRRDPLGPRFQTNFVLAQRVLQLSAAVPLAGGASRMVPIQFLHAPTPAKPPRKASAEELKNHRQAARLARLPLLAVQQITALRQALDEDSPDAPRRLHVHVDGGYTNETVLKQLPTGTTLIGRIRKDAKLHSLPPPAGHAAPRGRPRQYGSIAPTPEQLRVDESIPWTALEVCINGAPQQMRVKRLENVLWRTAGLKHTLQLVVIAPLGYRLRKNSKLLYRQPAFLICTDPALDLHSIVQGYIQRNDIETNFREEKTLLGVGQAQVRNPSSVQAAPALQVASYAMLLLASLRAVKGVVQPDLLPSPKWARHSPSPRFSTQRAIHQLRAEVWGRALGLENFSGFATHPSPDSKPEKLLPALGSAVLYANN